MAPLTMLAHLSGHLHTHAEGAAIGVIVFIVLTLCLAGRKRV
jgi:hypothetical protein